mgnify:CR=1 FL=1
MTLEHVAMAIVVVAVAVVAFLLGRVRGVQLGEDEIDSNDPSLFGAQKNMSLFGPRVLCSLRNASLLPSCRRR